MSLADKNTRDAALDIQHSVLVQAPAGSGKTELLTNRYLALLAVVESPEEVVAITFTRKAAAEMRHRVLKKLRQAAAIKQGQQSMPKETHEQETLTRALNVLNRDQDKDWQIMANAHRLRIQTFDSLCAFISKQIPLASRSGGGVKTEEDAQSLYQQAAQATLAELETEHYHPFISRLLAHLDNNGYSAQNLLMDMLAKREQWLSVLPQLQEEYDTDTWQIAYRLFAQAQLATLAAQFNAREQEELMELTAYACEQLRNSERENPFQALEGWQKKLTANLDDLPRWQRLCQFLHTKKGEWRKSFTVANGFPVGKGKEKEFKDRMNALMESLGELPTQPLQNSLILPDLNDFGTQRDFVGDLLIILHLAYGQLRKLFCQHSCADFTEIAHSASLALGSDEAPTDLALALDYKIQHLLVDECQDTSRAQIDLLRKLTAGWQDGDGRTAFLVGDPMQSIYRFRKADVGAFLRLRNEGLGDIHFQALSLQSNFRSQKNLVDWVNSVAQTLLSNHEDDLRGVVPFSASVAAKPALAKVNVQCHGFLSDEDYSLNEAKKVVALVKEALDHGDKSVAILGRARNHLRAIAAQLRTENIAFDAVDLEALAECSLIQDLVQLTRALLHPADRLAWLCVLRAPWCGLTLTDLHTLCADEPMQALAQLLKDDTRVGSLSADAQQRLENLRTVMHNAQRFQPRVSLAQYVRAAWMQLGGHALCTNAEDKAICAQFFELLDTLDPNGDDPLKELHQQLEKLYAKPSGGAQVTLMTMHKSKGLEFDCVILPQLGRKPRPDTAPLLQWETIQQGNMPLLLTGHVKGARSTARGASDWLKQLEKDRSENESNRLLYVALTRAKNRMHLLGAIKEDKEGYTPDKNSLLARLWPSVERAFSETLIHSESLPELHSDQPLEQMLTRMITPFTAPHFDEAKDLDGAKEAVDYAVWKDSERAKIVGTLTHSWLEQLTQHPALRLDSSSLPLIRKQCRWQGMEEAEIEGAASSIFNALMHTTQDKTGAWLLSHTGKEEWALQADEGATISRHVIDRSFIADGCRWIVDYKTARHEGSDLNAFIAERVREYTPQLERYAKIVAHTESLPMKLALFFPLQQQCYVWHPGETPTRFEVT